MNNSASSFYNTLPPAGFCVRTSKYFSMNWLRLYTTLILVLEKFAVLQKAVTFEQCSLYYSSWQIQENMSLKIRRFLLNSDAEIFSFWLSFTRKVHVESQNCWYFPYNSITSDHWNISVLFLTADVDILQLMKKSYVRGKFNKSSRFSPSLIESPCKEKEILYFFLLGSKML